MSAMYARRLTQVIKHMYEGVSKSFRTESTTKQTTITTTKLVEKQHKELWRQNSQYSDKTAHSGKELYHLQFSLQQAASPKTFRYTIVQYVGSQKNFSFSDESFASAQPHYSCVQQRLNMAYLHKT
jgi:hypothetical protein